MGRYGPQVMESPLEKNIAPIGANKKDAGSNTDVLFRYMALDPCYLKTLNPGENQVFISPPSS